MSIIAITGVSGQFAQTLLPVLEADPEIEKVIGIDIAPPRQQTNKLVFHECDVRDPKLELLFEDADIVVHLGFIIFYPYGKEALADDVNINGTINVANAAARAGVRKLIVASSVAAYGIHADNDRPLTEDSPLRGNEDFDYSRAKATIERHLESFAADHPQLMLAQIRPCIVLGPSTDPARYAMYKGPFFFRRRSGVEEVVQYIHEEDVVSAFHLAIKHDVSGAYNIAGPEPELLSDLARTVNMRVVGLPGFLFKLIELIVRSQWRRGKIPISPRWLSVVGTHPTCMSTKKIEQELGWRPRYTTREAFLATVQVPGRAKMLPHKT